VKARRTDGLPIGDLLAGVAVLAVVLAVSALALGVGLPFSGKPFEIRADVSTSAQLRSGSLVRLAGVDIGQVTAIERRGDRARLTLRIDRRREVIRADARLAIRPRLLLGGNDYVDLSPGTPAAAPMRSGGVVSLSRTSGPVELDQVLNVFDFPARTAMQSSLDALASGLGRSSAAGPSGAEGLRRAARELDDALVSVREVAAAARGQRPGDLRRAVRSTGDVTAQLVAGSPETLAALVEHYDRVFATLAAQDTQLEAGLRELADLTTDGPGALSKLDRALPPVRRLATALQPALRAAPPALGRGRQALTQLNRLIGPAELKGLLADLRPGTRALAPAVRRTTDVFRQLRPIVACVSKVVLPTLETEVPDGKLSSGRPVWQDALHMGANLAAFSNAFDGNGTTFRAGVSESEVPLTTQLPGGLKLYGSGDIAGVAPQYLQSVNDIQYRPDQPCEDQRPPDLSQRRLTGMPTGVTRAKNAPEPRTPTGLLRALLQRDRAAALRELDKLVPGARRTGRRRPPSRPLPLLTPKPKPKPAPSRPVPDRRPAPTVPPVRVPQVVPDEIKKPVEAVGDQVRDIVGGLLGPLAGGGGRR
jgi:virulence factor Mce-like protein